MPTDTPFPSASPLDCVCFGLNRAARAATRRYDAALKPSGITSGQFGILGALAKAGPMPLSRLAALLGLDRTTLNRNLRLLEAASLVDSAPDGTDARIRPLRLTEAGRRKLQEAVPLWHGVQAETVARVGPEAWRRLRAELQTLV